jgi:uncharacterized protein (DUF1501 family)
MLSRRDFVKTSLSGASLFAMAPAIPGFLAATARAAAPLQDGRVLVVVQLDGGNDGINTIVPLKDEGYARSRKALRLKARELLKVNDIVGLHPSLSKAARLLERGELAIVQGVGYPNPSRSHFQSMAIWHSARRDPEEHRGPGWLGRAFDERLAAGDASGTTFVGAGPPPAALNGRRSVPATLDRLEDLALKGEPGARATIAEAPSGDDLGAFVRRTALEAYTAAHHVAEMTRGRRSADEGSDGGLAGRLSLIARLVKSGARARVYYTQQGSYDTHASQLRTHADLLFELSEALSTFQADLEASGLADRVLVLCFSEFGRRVTENGSDGTDHGTAGPVLLLGKHVRAGLVGETPNLLDLEDGDLKVHVDFRRIYAAILQDWLALPSAGALGGRFDPLPLLQAK